MRLDFHLHSAASPDSLSDPERLLERARALGLGKLILTDHNTTKAALKLQEKYPDEVIVGEEILTTSGEILALFVREALPKRIAPEDAFRELRAQGAFISLSHPYAFARHGWSEREMEAYLPYLDAIEGFNGRNSKSQNAAALDFALNHDLPVTAGSDGHHISELGRCGLDLPPFASADELREVIRQGRIFGSESSPLVHLYSRYAVLAKKVKRN